MNSDFSNIGIWRNRFYKTGDLLGILYKKTFDKKGTRVKRDLLLYASQAEEIEEYLWVYLDYGIRTPVYRTLQYLRTAYPPKDGWSRIVSTRRGEDQEVIMSFINDLTAHIRKEYALAWSKILNRINDKLRKDDQLLKRVKSALGLDEDQMIGIEDVKGLESELKAVYVLVDHGKSFLPFSIMQAPITPSFIGSWPASGDLYLFEENLVVDVKSGWLDKETKLPIYKYEKPHEDLPGDLENIRDMGRLHGIRKGIGVLAEDKGYFYLAIYVPWRNWRTQGPLLQLKSAKLPFIIYMNNIEYTGAQRGVKPHKAVIEGTKLRLTISAYDIRERVSSEEKEKGISSEDMTLEFPRDPGVQVKGTISWNKGDDKRFTMEFEVDAGKVEKSIIGYGGEQIVLARLVVKRGETGERLVYPVLAVAE